MEILCKAANIKPLRMIKPVDTRWDSKSQMVARAIYLKPIIEDVCSKKSLTAQYDTRLLKLKREEWRIMEELSPVLGVCIMTPTPRAHAQPCLQAFHDVSLEMQSSRTPLVSSVIPRMDDLVCGIDDFKDDHTKHPAVRSAAMRGLAILNKYYQKTDESYVYRISMGMTSFDASGVALLTLVY